MEIYDHDSKCRSCEVRWLIYSENTNPCSTSSLRDGRHNFDFGKPVQKTLREEQINTSKEILEGNIIFQ